MVYGVDQCRVCGMPIQPRGPDVAADQEKANRHPLMPEKEWRRRGFLAPPTKKQIYVNPSDGCCAECGMKVIRQFSQFGLKTAVAGALILVLVIFVVFFVTYLPH